MRIGTHIARGEPDRRKASHYLARVDCSHAMKKSVHISLVPDMEFNHSFQRLTCVTPKEMSTSQSASVSTKTFLGGQEGCN